MIKAKLIVEGNVQKVGYRDYVQKTARKLGVKGYVENLRDGTVQIICELEDPILETFINALNIQEDFINVEKIRIAEKSEAKGEFDYFEIKYGKLEEELGERLGTATEYARATTTDIKHMHQEVKETKQSIQEMHADLKGSISSMHEETRGTRKDIQEITKSIQEMHADLKGSISSMHEETRGTRMGIQEMHRDLKDGVLGVQVEVKSMHHEINDRFDEMAKRYDVISSELVRTREELTRTVNALLELITAFIQERQRNQTRQT